MAGYRDAGAWRFRLRRRDEVLLAGAIDDTGDRNPATGAGTFEAAAPGCGDDVDGVGSAADGEFDSADCGDSSMN